MKHINMDRNSGYSGRPLFAKLGMKPGQRWNIINPPHNYLDLLGCVEDVHFTEEMKNLDGIHVFAESNSQVEQAMKEYRHAIKGNGMVWVSRCKKASKIDTDVNEDVIRDTALTLGLIDVKVCSVDEQWSALKIVWRKENRKGT